MGVDVFVVDKNVPKLPATVGNLKLEVITNRGAQLPLDGTSVSFMMVDWHRARYLSNTEVSAEEVSQLIQELSKVCEWEKVQKLYSQDSKPLYSKAK